MKSASVVDSEAANLLAEKLWDTLAESLEGDDGVIAEHLSAGRPVYFREKDTPAGHVVKLYATGRRELVIPVPLSDEPDRVVRVLVEGS